MDFEKLINGLNARQNGAFIKVVYSGDLPLNAASKKAGIVAKKVTEMTIRKGIDYDKQKSVREKIANGKILTHELPWGNWKEGYEGLIIEHKGTDYVRLYPSPNSTHTTYSINGVEMTYDELKDCGCILNSFFNKTGEKPDCYTVKVDNIVSILTE